MTKERFNMLVGSIGAFIGVFVFLAYIPQIIANLHAHRSGPEHRGPLLQGLPEG